jgi:hypothetical protein
MLELNRQHIDAIRFSKELSSVVARSLDDPALASRAAEHLSDADYDDLLDACLDALMNDAPTVHGITGEGDYGPFGIIVRGVAGAYFVGALEFDDEGPFTTLSLTICCGTPPRAVRTLTWARGRDRHRARLPAAPFRRVRR